MGLFIQNTVQPRGSGIWQEILPNVLATVLGDNTVAKKFYLPRAALCHNESSIGNVWLAIADPRKFSKVAKSCKFLKYHKNIIQFLRKKS